ncbi:MAG: class I SAM-dependent methyltransferase [Marinisporobacter sp.]|nr:class I SAM-dependent methyltransferase [Marinisporobacter sp.]
MSKPSVCPWWIGYILASPLRKLRQNPIKILDPYIYSGNKILDVGCGMGYFSVEMAKLVGDIGKVYCVDLQEKMLKGLQGRAKKRNVHHQIIPIQCSYQSLNINHLKESIDFALAFAVIHEVPDKDRFFKEIHDSLKEGGKLLFSEPKGHVRKENFDVSLDVAKSIGFNIGETIDISGSISIILEK